MTDDGYKIAMAANFHPEDGKAAVGVVEGHTLDRARQSFSAWAVFDLSAREFRHTPFIAGPASADQGREL